MASALSSRVAATDVSFSPRTPARRRASTDARPRRSISRGGGVRASASRGRGQDHPLFDVAARDVSRSYATSVGTPTDPTPTLPPGTIGGVVFVSSFLAALLRKRARRSGSSSDADLRRKFRGDLIRQRLKRAVGRNWMGQTMSLGRSNDATEVDTRERDFAGDRLRSTRDIAFARASGLVRADKTKPREEDVAWTLAATRRNAVAAAEFAAVSRGERLNGASMTSPPRSQSQSRQQQQQQQQSSTDVPITLCVTCPVRPGQRVAVLGEPAAFGGWDASRAALLDRVGEDRWQKACRVPAGEMEYRYALVYVRPNGEVVLETEVGGPRTRRVSSDAGPGGGNALMIDE
eukprot:15330-Pelagococcus_subviridis.AAC.1